MLNVFNYTDYRKFLMDFYEAKKALQKSFTHRHISQAVGFKSSGTVSQILKGTTNISPRTITQLGAFLELKKEEAEYFELLVFFNQSGTHAEKRKYFERLTAFPKSKPAVVDAGQYAFYDKWYYSVIREILAFHPFRQDYKALAKMLEPAISPGQARKAIKLLERLKLIRKNGRGYYEKTDPVITSGNAVPSLAINQFMLDTLELAKSALDHLPKEERSLSALTLSLDEEGYRRVEEKIAALRRELLELARNCAEPRRVVQVNFQAFPVSRIQPEDDR